MTQGSIDSYTKLMLHGDGIDASTTITDSEITPKTVTANGNAQIDTAQFKFGTASILFDGTGDYLSIPDHVDWDATGAYTVDFWVRFAAAANEMYLVGQMDHSAAANGGWALLVGGATGTNLVLDIQNVTVMQPAPSFSTNTWYHVAWTRDTAGDNRLFVDGTQIGSTTNNNTATSSTEALLIGQQPPTSGGKNLNGWIEELRISKGIARWTANFTVPNRAYSKLQGGLVMFDW